MSLAMDIVECPICGKKFIPAPASIYYVVNKQGRRVHVCGWNCYNKAKVASWATTQKRDRYTIKD